MDSLKRTSHWKSTRFRYLLVALVALVLLVLFAIIIPHALIVPKENAPTTLKSNVLVPLYIYPAAKAWTPLYDAIIKHPRLNFTIIVNPNSGPGTDLYPDVDYISKIEKLNALPNARTLGYVHISYAQRDIQSVLKDVAIYSGWAKGNLDASTPGFAVQGIFVDEVPTAYSPEVAEYLKTVNLAIKNSPGILGKKLIIHNPGQVPDNRFSDSNTDTTVVFEETYQSFQPREAELARLSQERSRYGLLIHSLPRAMSKGDLRSLLAKASQKAGYLFVTNLDRNYFESFGPIWSTFINALPA
ncbi:putative coatomer subunit alpha [Venturia nashicola]|uniref:Putative coatomer subunit alpha n=1 Tax=Venturia nashicola TaxID=86259 RepID=A0A4Z1PGY9_9PEZI|nr:putative coatomer subunit alpha [Venturia nashicola]TLD35294.1 putative coatomer subunit alpha [Venturia nashicola]